MKATPEGFELSAAELTLLLAYTEPKSPMCCLVMFSVSERGAQAYATDGTCSVHGIGDCTGFGQGEGGGQWYVTPEILKAIKKELHANDFVRLHFVGESLTEYTRLALVRGDEGEPYIEERQTSRWHEDAVDHQRQLPFTEETGKRFSNDVGVPVVLYRELKRVALLDSLPTSGTAMLSGRRARDGVQFTATTTDDGTEWTVTLLPEDVAVEDDGGAED